MQIRLGYSTESLKEKAEQLSAALNLIIDNTYLPRLVVTATRLELWSEIGNPIWVDFATYIAERNNIERQGLVKAVKPTKGQIIWDATAGLGRDASILAHFGAKVIMFERVLWLASLLEDGLERKPNNLDLRLVKGDVYTAIDGRELLMPHVIYMDPMHPTRTKTALVKKEMQILQSLISPTKEVEVFIEKARQYCVDRVVVKWPARLPPLLVPNYSIEGKTIRYDVYRPA